MEGAGAEVRMVDLEEVGVQSVVMQEVAVPAVLVEVAEEAAVVVGCEVVGSRAAMERIEAAGEAAGRALVRMEEGVERVKRVEAREGEVEEVRAVA